MVPSCPSARLELEPQSARARVNWTSSNPRPPASPATPTPVNAPGSCDDPCDCHRRRVVHRHEWQRLVRQRRELSPTCLSGSSMKTRTTFATDSSRSTTSTTTRTTTRSMATSTACCAWTTRAGAARTSPRASRRSNLIIMSDSTPTGCVPSSMPSTLTDHRRGDPALATCRRYLFAGSQRQSVARGHDDRGNRRWHGPVAGHAEQLHGALHDGADDLSIHDHRGNRGLPVPTRLR